MARTRSGRRTDYQWFNLGDVEVTQDLGVATAKFGSVGFDILRPQTLTRIRGKVGVMLDAGGVGESAMILVGLTVLTNDSFITGQAPELFNASLDEGNWLWQGALYVASGDEGAVVADGLFDRLEIDSKAMRRMKASDTIAFVHQIPTELLSDATGTYNLTWYIHGLLGS